MKNEEQFDDLLRQKANNHEAPVPADAWNNIMQQRKKRRFIFFWWCLAGVLIAGNIGYFIYKDQHQNTTATERVQQNPMPAPISDKKDANEHTVSRKETNDLQKEKNDRINNTEPVIASDLEKKNAGEGITNNKKQELLLLSKKEQKVVKKQDMEINKKDAEIAAEKKGKRSKNIINSNDKLQQKIADKLRYTQPLNELAEKKIKSGGKNLLEGKGSVVIENGMKKAGFEDIEIVDEIAAKTYNETASEKDAFAILKQTTQDVVSGRKSTEKNVTNDVVKTFNGMKKLEKNVHFDTSFKVANIDSIEPSEIGMSDKKPMKNIAPTIGSKWWVDISATPFASISTSKTISQLNRTTQMAGYVAAYTADKVKISQEPGVVYGITLRKNVSKKWALGLGFQYQQIKEKISMSGTETHTSTTIVQRLEQNNSGPVLVNDTITNVATGTRTIDALNNYTLMSVPIFAQYHLLNKRNWLLDWSVGGFVNISRKYSNSVDGLFVEQSSITIKPEGQSKVGFDLFTEIRMSNALTKNIFAFAAPGFRYNFSEYKMPGMFKYTFLHQAGLSLGLSIKL